MLLQLKSGATFFKQDFIGAKVLGLSITRTLVQKNVVVKVRITDHSNNYGENLPDLKTISFEM